LAAAPGHGIVATVLNGFQLAEKAMHMIEAHGARIPAIGLGTMTLKGAVCVDVVKAALQSGYRHIDTAERYENETEVGEGLHASGIKRDDIFVTTKVYWTDAAAGDFARSVEASLKRLRLSAVDLLLIHWPNPKVPLAETVGALCKAKRDGLTKHVGVANFTVGLIDEAVRLASEPLVTNQVEVHPFLDQSKVIAACKRHGLSVTAYCPLARGKVPGSDVLQRIGQAHGKSATQVALRWLVQQGIIPIPRTSKIERLSENLAVFDFTLTASEMAEIETLKRPDGRCVNPAHAPMWDK
jgi:diketogulonate reductase-like aldo/keto reductase